MRTRVGLDNGIHILFCNPHYLSLEQPPKNWPQVSFLGQCPTTFIIRIIAGRVPGRIFTFGFIDEEPETHTQEGAQCSHWPFRSQDERPTLLIPRPERFLPRTGHLPHGRLDDEIPIKIMVSDQSGGAYIVLGSSSLVSRPRVMVIGLPALPEANSPYSTRARRAVVLIASRHQSLPGPRLREIRSSSGGTRPEMPSVRRSALCVSQSGLSLHCTAAPGRG